MITNMQNITIRYYDTLINIVGTLTVSLVFCSGFGRYRVVLVYAIYYLINTLLSIGKPGRKARYLFFPATLAAIYFDILDGPFYPLFMKNSLLIALPLMVVIDQFAKDYSTKIISRVAKGQIFQVCPKCKYKNRYLVSICSNCTFKNEDQIEPISNNQRTFQSLPNKVVHMIELKHDEEILFYIRLFPFRSVVKNGERQIRTYFIITNYNIVFLDYFFFSESWREKDTIPLKSVVSIDGKMKKIYLYKEPFFEIKTSNKETYEIIFRKFDKYNEYFAVIKDKIMSQMNSHR